MDPIKFDFTKEDFIAFNLYHFQNSPILKRQRWRTALVLLVCSWLLALFCVVEPTFRGMWPVALFFGIIGLGIPLGWRSNARKTVDRMLGEGQNRSLLGPKEVMITPVEITSAGELKSLTVRWAAVEKVVVDSGYLYVYHSSLEAVVIPSRAFVDDAGFDSVVDMVLKYWDETKSAQKT